MIWHPNLRQEVGGIQLRQHGRVDDIGFDAGLGNELHLAWVGNHHASDMWRQHLADRCRVAGRLDYDMVVMRQCLGEAV